MYRRILVPLDQSATSQRGLQEAIHLAKAFDASLVLLHVVEYFPMMADMTGTVVLEQVASQMPASNCCSARTRPPAPPAWPPKRTWKTWLRRACATWSCNKRRITGATSS
jgi:hypothetical protein